MIIQNSKFKIQNQNLKLKIFGVLLFLLFTAYGLQSTVLAQVTSIGVARTVSVNGDNVSDNSVICTANDGFKLCDTPYDGSMYGVVSDSASVSLDSADIENGRPVVSDGVVVVRAVNTADASIKKGSLITSSATPGVVEPAVHNGYVLGVSLEDLSSQPGEEGKILVEINIHPAIGLAGFRSNLIDLLRGGSASVLDPLASLRYVLAALVVIISFVLGFVYFGRIAREGLAALGRNPLASRSIQLSIFVNVILMIVIVVVGLVLGYLILIL